MRHNLLIFTLLLLPTIASAQANPDRFDAILKAAVRDERIDYALIQKDHAGQLQAYLDELAQVDPATLDEKSRLAHYINLYNASMIQAVIERDPQRFKPSDDEFKVFKEPIVRTRSGNVSLDDIENQIIRKQFADPRIHAALVCGAVSCPPILDRAYRGETLDQTLDANVQRWLADPKRNVIDHENKTLKLSEIFKWFAVDFGGEQNVTGWISQKLGRDVTGYRIESLPYDWSLNKPDAPRDR